MALSYVFTDDLAGFNETGLEGARRPFYFGSPDREVGIADIDQAADDNDDVLVGGVLDAAAGFADTGTSVGGGEALGVHEKAVDFHDTGAMPLFDEDDELGIPHALDTDNISDTAVTARFSAVLHGVVYET